ncbi:MAG TPA: glycoside hydrolase family 15 protein [Dehalococcoidia bacterium]|nr:glycoside hydrolase family 15 protein [Dehalococcoidia bacterium]
MRDPCDPFPPQSEYALIGDMQSCALVSRGGSIDWLCFPRFDSPSTFGRILDWERGGYFQLVPRGITSVERSYVPNTNVLETTFHTGTGSARLTDFMPVDCEQDEEIPAPRETRARLEVARILVCTRGSIEFEMECHPRFDYGTIVPHAHLSNGHAGVAHGGADCIEIHSSAKLRAVEGGFTASGRLAKGEQVHAAVSYRDHRYDHHVDPIDHGLWDKRLRDTICYWERWSDKNTYEGPYRDEVMRSALVLKALTYSPTGAIIAAPTTSLPEVIGGVRNWDYRYTWIRDATLALYALFILGYTEEAEDFKSWLEWSTLGRARDLQPMYGVRGERRLHEIELSGLSGHCGSRPVRIGNDAYRQHQLDIYGELMDSAHQYRKYGGQISDDYWQYLRRVVSFVMDHWQEPDDGVWETRSGRQHFVLSKVMCWVALDRAIKAAKALGLPGDIDRWRAVRAEIREDVLARGFDEERGAFVQHYGAHTLDAANLLLPLVGFISPNDPRMRATIDATAAELMSPEGFVYRYLDYDDGLPGDEGAFVICTFWLADNYIMLGEVDRARELLERCLAAANDVGLFGEQYDPRSRQILGNFPQAFSHLGLINTAVQLRRAEINLRETRLD